MTNIFRKIYFGYWVVLTGFLILVIRAGIGMQTLGFLIEPMQYELNWSSTSITFSLTLQLIIAAIIAPCIGRRMDVFGAKNILVVGLIMNGIMLVLMSFSQHLWQLALVVGVLGGISQACIGNSLVMPFVSKWFYKNRGTMMGIASSGASLGAAILSVVVAKLLEHTDSWRSTWFIIGWLPIIIAPFVYFILKQQNMKMENLDKPTSSNHKEENSEISFTVKEVLKSPIFWMLILAWNLADFISKGALLNRIPFSLEMGFDVSDAAEIVVVYGIMAIFIKICIGWLSDKISPHTLAMFLCLLQTVGLVLFIYGGNNIALSYSYSALSGISSGGLIALMPIILAKYYGNKFQGAISGITNPLLLFASIGGPLSASIIKDITGSYEKGFILYTLLSAVTIILFALLKKPKISGIVSKG